MVAYALNINGKAQTFESDDPDQPLLYVLRGIGLTGTKFGCGLGQCGACTVLLDGQSARSCLTAISQAVGRSVTTIEGLGTVAQPSKASAVLYQGKRSAVRLLHLRHDRGCGSSASPHTESDRNTDP